MKLLKYLVNFGDNAKQREYVSDADKFMAEFDKNQPALSDSQKHEINKHKDIFYRQQKFDLFK
ncbi:hypothetical protein OAO18_01330 [Francisellaceae bacterium]|jgi:hypothetical protein|nr:hypothetical protein [Francisellaceae bacterium]